MTCVVAYRMKGRGVIIVGDSQATDESFYYEVRKDPKVFKLGNIVFGISGSYRLRDLLMYELKLPKRLHNESIDKYMRVKLTEEIRKLFIEKGCIRIKDGEQESIGNILVGIKDRLFRIDGDFQVAEVVSDYDAIGCGDKLAYGALDMTRVTGYLDKMKRTPESITSLLNTVITLVANRSCGVNSKTVVETTIE